MPSIPRSCPSPRRCVECDLQGGCGMNTPPICGYCDCSTEIKTGQSVYPHRQDLYELNFWVCPNCGAYTGCHKKGARVSQNKGIVISDGTLPLGVPANAVLRKLRMKAHSLFDPVWKNGRIRRKEAYARMAAHLGIPRDECHISHFDERKIKRFIDAVPIVFPDERAGI